MKKIVVLTLFLVVIGAAASWATPSYYGLNGFNFIPKARTAGAGNHELAVTSAPVTGSDLNIFPYSVRGYFTFSDWFELGLTNTYGYYLEETVTYLDAFVASGGGFIGNTATVYAPIIPSIKLAFLDAAVPNGSLAVGFEYPYGLFFCHDYLITLNRRTSIYILAGLATSFSTLYGFGGIEADFDMGFKVRLEGAYGGKTEFITKPQESFFSAGVSYGFLENVDFEFVFRFDQDMVRRMVLGYSVKF